MTETYNTGKPCRNGHTADRYVSTKRCIECVRAKHDRYYAGHAEDYKRRAKEHYRRDPEHERQTRAAYHARMKENAEYQAHRAEYAEKTRAYQLMLKRAKSATPEAKAERAAKRKEKSAQYRAYEQKRRAKLICAVPQWTGELDELVFTEAAELCDLRKRVLRSEWQLDHMIPLLARSASGLHCAANIQVIPAKLNRTKNNRLWLTEPLDWLRFI